MRTFQSTISGFTCALTLAIAASPALAGHKHGGHHYYGGYGMPYGKPHYMHPRGAHPACHGKMGKHGHARAYGHGYKKYGHPGWHPMMKKEGYKKPSHGYGADQSGMKPEGYAKSAPAAGSAGDYGAAGTSPAAPAQKNIVGTAVAAGDFSTLVSAVKAAGLVDTLSGKGPFTVLAPNDAAFSKLPQEQVAGLMSDPEALKGVLTYHVISGELSAADLLEQGEATTVNGAKVSVAQLDVAKADIKASNGVIHVLNAVLIPAE